VKIMASLNIAEKRLPQDGRITLKIAGKSVDIRVSTVPTSRGFERIVMRILHKTSVLLSLEDLGFAYREFRMMDDLIKRPDGIILVTGPTGSGKTTTLYAASTASTSRTSTSSPPRIPSSTRSAASTRCTCTRRSGSPSRARCAPSSAKTPT
jgi:type II secretory ATPase GspE/PulE/Tfp pilus assembly ATPase PilB-like protein